MRAAMKRGVASAMRRGFAFFDVRDVLAEYNRADTNDDQITPRLELFATDFPLTSYPTQILDMAFTRPPSLKYNLDKLVRTEGIYPVDELIRLNGGDNFLREIPPATPEVMARFGSYRPPSQDSSLKKASIEHNAKFVASSSSLTEAMTQIWYVLSNFRSPNLSGLGQNFDNRNANYMTTYRKPTVIMLRKLPGTNAYAIDGDKGNFPSTNKILTDMGIVLETMITTDKEVFKRLMDPKSDISQKEVSDVLSGSRSHRMRKMGNFLIRSQIDSDFVTEQGEYFVFEIKTRACTPIRYDVKNYQDYLDYEINRRTGYDSSFEREYYDLIRSLLPKYFFQIKLGGMDGALIAYHNTRKMYGFEYVRLAEMERRLFGTQEFSWVIVSACIQLLELVLEEALKICPGQEMLRIGFYAEFKNNKLVVTVEKQDGLTEWKEDYDIVEGIEDEFDYYEVHARGKTAQVFSLNLFPYINGILQREPLFLESGDSLSLKYLTSYRGVMPYLEYMCFLHNAYKFDTSLYNREYSGNWKRFNDFHIFRKPVYSGISLS